MPYFAPEPKHKMSRVEEECRMDIALAYLIWYTKTQPMPLPCLLAYEQAIGLDIPF